MMDNIEIKVLENGEENWVLLLDAWYDFWDNNPITSEITVFRSEKGREYLKRILKAMVILIDYPLVIAWDKVKEQVAGFSLNNVTTRDMTEQQVEKLRSRASIIDSVGFTDEEKSAIIKLRKFLAKVDERTDFFNRFEVQSYFEVFFLGVRTEYGKKGLGRRLVEHSLDIAKSLGYSIVLSHLSSTFSAKLCYSCGFEAIAETSNADYFEMSEEIKSLHPKCVSMVKRL